MLTALLGIWPCLGHADAHLPPWTAGGFPRWARSVHVPKGDQPIRSEPKASASRRGSASRLARLPLFGAVLGPGCRGHWLHVGPQAWICQDDVELSGHAPVDAGAVSLWRGRSAPDGLPFRYYFVGPMGSLAYDKIDEVDIGEPAMSLEPGFAVAIVEQRTVARSPYGRTNRGLWVPMRDLGLARPMAFHGSEIEQPVTDRIPFAWVHKDRAPLYARRGKLMMVTGRHKARFDRVAVVDTMQTLQGSFLRIDEAQWISTRSVRHPSLAPPPPEVAVGLGERWLDIELSSQTLVAYQGSTPVFATLVSTGKGRSPRSAFATPKGTHRVWVKLLSSVMDNLENEDAARYYRIEDVPYVQYFAKGVGLHAAFWHRSFGRVRSHGCVNLTPLDARWLFGWTTPRLPTGWTAVLPTRFEPGTVVRVR